MRLTHSRSRGRSAPCARRSQQAFDEYAAKGPKLTPLWYLCRRAAPPARANENIDDVYAGDPFEVDELAADKPDDGWCAEHFFFDHVKSRLMLLVGRYRRSGPAELQTVARLRASMSLLENQLRAFDLKLIDPIVHRDDSHREKLLREKQLATQELQELQDRLEQVESELEASRQQPHAAVTARSSESVLPLRDRLGRRVHDLRDQHGLSQPILAKRSGVPLPMLVSIECGLRDASVEMLMAIGQALGVSLSELFYTVDGPTPSQTKLVDGNRSGEKQRSLPTAVRAFERTLIARVLKENAGNITKAATSLRVTRQSLQRKMRRLGIGERS